MDLILKPSRRMTQRGEDNLVRVSPSKRLELERKLGNRIYLSTPAGKKVPVYVEDALLEDNPSTETIAYVSKKTYDLVNGVGEKFKMTLGCDPEFVFTNDCRFVYPASRWLPHRGKIGHDGPLAELRPDPGDHEDQVVENLRQLIRSLPGMIGKRFRRHDAYTPEAHSCWENYALGFHIHIGLPRELLTFAAPNTREFLESLVAALDYFVGIPAMLLEDTNVRRLGDGQYGKPGDYRISSRTIEYRTPGGFHLRHPYYAAGIMGLALCVSKDIVEEAEEASGGWANLDRVSSYNRLQRRFNLPNKSEIKLALLEPTKSKALSHVPNLAEQLLKLRHYSEHSSSIQRYFALLATNKQYSPILLQNW